MSDITERLMRFTHYQRVWHQWDEDGKQNLGDAITEAVEELDRTRAKLADVEAELGVAYKRLDAATAAVSGANNLASRIKYKLDDTANKCDDLTVANQDLVTINNQLMAECSRLRSEVGRVRSEAIASIYEWRLSLVSPTDDDPFRKIECAIVDIGFADKVIVIEAAKAGDSR